MTKLIRALTGIPRGNSTALSTHGGISENLPALLSARRIKRVFYINDFRSFSRFARAGDVCINRNLSHRCEGAAARTASPRTVARGRRRDRLRGF